MIKQGDMITLNYAGDVLIQSPEQEIPEGYVPVGIVERPGDHSAVVRLQKSVKVGPRKFVVFDLEQQ